MNNRQRLRHTRLMCGAAVVALAIATGAQAQTRISIAPQPLDTALNELGAQGNQQVLIRSDVATGKMTRGVSDAPSFEIALGELLQGTGLTWRREGETFLIVSANDPQSGSAAGDGADGTVDTLIVTAQKREEDIQDVPIAISAFTQEDLTRSQVAGGPDLITQVPNMTFTKTNFSSYSIQIRGIGTQAISATTDPAVAVAFNNTPFIRNRFFEQEFYDLQRVEVLRGPQGTLYGRNATAGVVNIISAKPKFVAEAKLSGDIGNFSSSRIEGMVNIPLVEDAVALRVAGAWTKRDGYATNEITAAPIDGRDLWSTRVSLRISPSDRFDANLIWEHFEEDDDRLRSGKQLCKKDVITEVLAADTHPLGTDVTNIPYFQTLQNLGQSGALWAGVQATLSQGCARTSLYSPEAFQTPNGLSIPYYVPLSAIGLPAALTDPYVSAVQSQDLRVIESTVDPTYQAKSDLGELQFSFDLTDSLTLQSETAYATDTVFSVQDFNRFNTASGAWRSFDSRPGVIEAGPNGGIFCDPQIGCADRLVAVDLSTAKARQFSQELRLSSDFDGPFNFSLGANFLRADSEDKYYVFINSLTLSAAGGFSSAMSAPYIPGVSDNSECLQDQARGPIPGDPNDVYSVVGFRGCIYIDPNPIGALNDEGHNYFLSKNPYKLISYALFGEAYYELSENLKVTGGLRFTVDKKEAPRIPSWLLASKTLGYPVAEVIEQEWREPTGRLAIDWKPDLSFTDETLLYASLARGYKAGGANPPGFVRVFYGSPEVAQGNSDASATRPKTFDAEYVNAIEFGSKNTLLDGAVTANIAAFYYDYTGYQVSEIVDRSAFNRNFDTTVWGVELEADWRPLENLRLGFKGGYQKTRIKDGERAIDLMDRTAGRADWVVVRPFPTFASNCILPTYLFAHEGPDAFDLYGLGAVGGGGMGGCELAYQQGLDPVTHLPYVANPTVNDGTLQYWLPGTYPGFNPNDESQGHNHGEGFFKELGGNELPNAPNWTGTITADYTVPLPNDWLATLHTDLHWQAESWWRVFNDHEFSKLDEYFTMNLAAIFVNEEAGWNVMAYVKNVTDVTAITGAFLLSDDTGLTTNVFLTEPRLYGLRVTKAWTGGAWWGGEDRQHPAGEPYPLAIELGGQVQRQDAPYASARPSFLDEFSSGLQPASADAQSKDLDWGDGGEVKLTYTPQGGLWRIAAGWRSGETNRGDKFAATEFGDSGCLFFSSTPATCNPALLFTGTNYVRGTVHDREEHDLIDFMVGREFGLGTTNLKASLSGGLRYAAFKSRTGLSMEGVPDWDVPDRNVYFSNPIRHHHYRADFETVREFEGAGPVMSWEMAKRLLGQDDSHIDIEAAIEGGVLFGKQETSIAGDEEGAYFVGVQGYYNSHLSSQVGPTVVTTPPVARSTSVTVPTFGASLGLSYEIQRVKIRAGYRWERYFDVLDVGYDEHEDADRTIDGPYFKVSVGFGGG